MSNYTTMEEAIHWMAEEQGKNPDRDRVGLVRDINDARRVFYTLYQKVRLDFHIEGCVAVQEFCVPCINCDTPETYLGISLPAEIEQLEALWTGCQSVPLYDKWVEYKTFRRSSDSCLTKGIDMGGDWPIQADIPCGQCAKLKFTATDQSDCGKVVTVRYRDAGYEHRTQRIPLSMDGQCIETPAYSVDRPGGIVLPVGLNGGVLVTNATDGQPFGTLHPKITVPTFRRHKLAGVCKGDHVAFRATRKYTELYFDWDVIEVGGEQKLALIEAHRYNKLIGSGSADPAWIAKANVHFQNVSQYIAGSNMRSDGATVTRRIDLFDPEIRHRNTLWKSRR